MQTVTIRCWRILNFDGRARGEKKLGGYMPANGDKWGHIRALNLPTIESFANGLVFRPGLQIDGYRLCGIAWGLISLAANAPIRGTLTHQPDEAIRPLDEFRIADNLGINLAEWKYAATALTGSVLAYQEIAFQVRPEQAAAYTVDRQLNLDFFGPTQSARSTFPAAQHETIHHEMRRDETRRDDYRPLNPSGATGKSGDDNENENDAGDGVSDPVAQARQTNERMLSYVRTGHARQALEHWQALLCLLLFDQREPTERDRAQWERMFTSIYVSPGLAQSGPADDVRVDQFRKASAKAFELHLQRDIRNRAAVFATWAKQKGYLREKQPR